jgi:hypothetical protein
MLKAGVPSSNIVAPITERADFDELLAEGEQQLKGKNYQHTRALLRLLEGWPLPPEDDEPA